MTNKLAVSWTNCSIIFRVPVHNKQLYKKHSPPLEAPEMALPPAPSLDTLDTAAGL